MNILKPFKIFIPLFGLLVLIASRGFAQDISVEAELSSKQVALGSTAQLTITVNGSQDVEPIQFPKIEGFNVDYLGPSTRVSIINGQYSSSKTFTYSLFPLKEGRFQIPAFRVPVSGKTYVTQPISVEVGGQAEQAALSSRDRPASLKDKIFTVLKVPKREIYLNERLTIKILVFISGLSVRDIQYPEFDSIGFSFGEYEKPRQYQQVINGVRCDVLEFNAQIYPTRTGNLRLGPAKTSCNILVRSSSGGPARFGGRNSVFDDDFFNSFFSRHEKRPIVLESDEVMVNVLPLPQEGRPEDFSGAVGEFNFNVSVGPTEIKEGDPITLRMTVLGEGNLAAIQMPSLPPDAHFKLYDPQIFEKNNIKKIEQVIIPRTGQLTEVPAIQFSYFDPQLKKYRTIKKGPFPIKVTRLEKGEEFKIVGLEGEMRNVEPETFGQDIVFIKDGPGRLRLAGRAFYNRGLFYVVIFLAVVLWLGGFIYYKRTYRIKTDIVYARRLQAPRQAKQGLATAKKLMAARKKEEFYDAVFKTIQQYLGNKLHLSSGAITFETVQAHLSVKRVEQEIINDIKLAYDECDMIRYASADVSQENMNASYQRLAQVIDHLERFLK